LKKYGKLLMANVPEKTVDLLKKLCSKYDCKLFFSILIVYFCSSVS
jgi:hypothetical protein